MYPPPSSTPLVIVNSAPGDVLEAWRGDASLALRGIGSGLLGYR